MVPADWTTGTLRAEESVGDVLFIKEMSISIISGVAIQALLGKQRFFRDVTKHPCASTDESPLPNPIVLPISLLPRFNHTFLIRRPEVC